MRNALLAMLMAGFLMFSSISCVTVVGPENVSSVPSLPLVKGGNYIGMPATEVLMLLGPPTDIGECRIELPTPRTKFKFTTKTVVGGAAAWHQDGQDEEHLIHVLVQLCAVYGTVVSQQMHVTDNKFIEGETIINTGYTDYILLRKILEAGPKKDGKDGEYILTPGEIEI